ncbi:MAG: hypothetical protein PVG71_08825 [Anaerolineae bacterium]
MTEVDVPERGTHWLKHVVLDGDGTISIGGRPVEGVVQRATWLQ